MREQIELTEPERAMVEDLEWSRHAPEVRQHPGQLVVVRRRRVVAVGTDRAALVRQAATAEGCAEGELLVIVVPRGDLSEIPH
jgi:hypothetical protein